MTRLGVSDREVELAEILSEYIDVLNGAGLRSPQERAYRRRYRFDGEAASVLGTARMLHWFFRLVPDLGWPDVRPSRDSSDCKRTGKG